MKTCKLVICDIDGTIVVKHKKLTSRAKKVINLLQQNGIYFGIASGRPIFQIKETIKGWGYDDFDVLIADEFGHGIIFFFQHFGLVFGIVSGLEAIAYSLQYKKV